MQRDITECLLGLVKYIKELKNEENLCLSGGVFNNVLLITQSVSLEYLRIYGVAQHLETMAFQYDIHICVMKNILMIIICCLIE